MNETATPDSSANATAKTMTRSSSYARDQLANERTFLAWLRTAVALMSFGIFIVKLRYIFPTVSTQPSPAVRATELGLMFAFVGLAMILFSLWHYFATRRAIDNDVYEPEGASVVIFAVAIAAIGIGIVIYLLTSPAPDIPIPMAHAGRT